MSDYDVSVLPESKDLVIDPCGLYHLLSRPNALVLPENVLSKLSNTTASTTSPLKLVTPQQAIDSMSKLSTFDGRFVYSCDEVVSSDFIGKAICSYCDNAMEDVFHWCSTCCMTICHQCFTGENDNDDDADDQSLDTPNVTNAMSASLIHCRDTHNVQTRVQKPELLQFDPTSFECDECQMKFTGEEKKWFNLPFAYNYCADCYDQLNEPVIKCYLKEYTPGMSLEDVMALFDMVQVTPDYKESTNNFGSLWNWVPVLDEPSDAVYSEVNLSPEPITIYQDGKFVESKVRGGSIVVNCNPESKLYGRIGVVLNSDDGVELWFYLSEESLESVISTVAEVGGLKRYLIRNRFRDQEGKLCSHSFGSRVWSPVAHDLTHAIPDMDLLNIGDAGGDDSFVDDDGDDGSFVDDDADDDDGGL